MVQELTIISAPLGPASEIISQTRKTVFETLRAAKHVLIQKQNFKKFSHYLHHMGSVLKELQRQNLDCSESFKNAVEILHREVKASRQLILDCTNKNRVYLLVNCRRIVQSIDHSTKEIARALDLLPLASPDVSLGIQEKMIDIGKNMMDCEYSTSKAEEEIMTKIEVGIRERKTDRSYANELMIQIAEAVGISPSNSVFKTELEEFKREIKMGEELQMEQIIALLETSDVIMSHDEKERKYFDKRNLLGQQTLEPLPSFYCPITLEVMADPVEIMSGMTFEKCAISRWFEMGNRNCPLTLMPLERLDLRPNKNMRQLIEEWKERNNMMTVASIRLKLESSDEEEAVRCLERLRGLCSEKEAHREWVMLENYVPVLAGLLHVKNGEIRRHVLDILLSLANDSNENKETICGTDNALEYVVRSLACNINESKLAVQLLHELSKCGVGRQAMGKIRGCIFALVTISMKDDNEIQIDAQRVLQTLAFINENVVQMANANYFRPLLHLLNSGTEDEKMTIAKTLSEIEMTERQKLYLSEQGILRRLLELLSHDDAETKMATVKCLESLSMVRQNGRKMIKELGFFAPLLDLLYRHGSSSPATSLREHVSTTIMHLAQSTTISRQDSLEDLDEVSLLESEDDIFKLFCLISLTGPNIQCNIMRAFRAMCRSPLGSYIRTKLRQLSAVQVLVQLCEAHNLSVRANAVKLFCCLTEDNLDYSIIEHVNRKCVETLLQITETSADTGETAAAMGIISNLPKDTQITQWLLEAGALQSILTFFSQETRNVPSKKCRILENAVGALYRFTVSTNLEWQKRVAESGIIPHLVQFLICGTTLMKQNSTVCLKQLSESSSVLTLPVKKNAVFRCFAAPPEAVCPAHSGFCSVESSFCLVEANAVDPLVKLLRDKDVGVCEAALEALLTLIEGERLLSGSNVLASANAVGPIVRLLSSSSVKLKEKCLKALHRLFESVEVKHKFGISAHMAILEITQRDDTGMKSLAAKVLAQLGVLQDQSSFF